MTCNKPDRKEQTAALDGVLKAINSTLEGLRGALALLLGACLTIAALVIGTTDEAIFRDSAEVVPALGIKLQIKTMYIIAPAILLFLHIQVLLSLRNIHEKIQIFLTNSQNFYSDKDLRQLIVGGLNAAIFIEAMLPDARRGAALARAFFVVSIFIVPCALLLAIQISFVRYQSWPVTLWHMGLLAIDVVFSLMGHALIVNTVNKNNSGIILSLVKGSRIVIKFVILLCLVWISLAAHPPLLSTDIEKYNHFINISDENPKKYFGEQAWQWPVDMFMCQTLNFGCRYLSLSQKLLIDTSVDPKFITAAIHDNDEQKKEIQKLFSLHLGGRSFRFITLAGSRLYTIDLAGADLSKADLQKTNFTGADLSDATLTSANLASATLTGANLVLATLTGAYLSGADLSGANLEDATLTSADLSDATLTSANLASATLTSAILWDATLTGANLEGATLTGANLWNATLTGANLAYAKLTGADLSRATLIGANLWNATLTGAVLSGATLIGANLWNATLTGAELSRATLTGTILRRARIGSGKLPAARIDGAARELDLPAAFGEVGSCENVDSRDLDDTVDAPDILPGGDKKIDAKLAEKLDRRAPAQPPVGLRCPNSLSIKDQFFGEEKMVITWIETACKFPESARIIAGYSIHNSSPTDLLITGGSSLPSYPHFHARIRAIRAGTESPLCAALKAAADALPERYFRLTKPPSPIAP